VLATTDELREDLRFYLRKKLGARSLEVSEFTPIPEGHSGFTYFVTTRDGDQEERYVLRLPPPGARIAGPADIPRQGRIMAALNEQGLPTPHIIINCKDPELDGRPFVLMERVEGNRIETIAEEVAPAEVAKEAIRVLHRLQQVPLLHTGIGQEARTSLTEEMIRWAWLMQRAPEELTGVAPALGERLAEKRPAEPAPCLVHADYHFGNMLFRKRGDGSVEMTALLDWEIAEIGAPMLDLGCLCIVAQRREIDPDAPNPAGAINIDTDQVIELYGADPRESRWYLALSCYKYASIFGYNLMLHRRGKRPDPMYEKLTGVITALIDSGLELLE
jgi:aminoglycoside phosphotransferase (APT) family kinase protein